MAKDSVERSNIQEVVVQLTPQDVQRLIGFLAVIGVLHGGTGDWPTDIDRDNARRLQGYLETVYAVNGYIAS